MRKFNLFFIVWCIFTLTGISLAKSNYKYIDLTDSESNIEYIKVETDDGTFKVYKNGVVEQLKWERLYPKQNDNYWYYWQWIDYNVVYTEDNVLEFKNGTSDNILTPIIE